MTPRSRSHTYKLYSCWKNNRWPTGRLSEGRTSLPPLWSQRDQPTGQHRTMLNCHLSQATGSPTRTWELSLASCQQATTKISRTIMEFKINGSTQIIRQWTLSHCSQTTNLQLTHHSSDRIHKMEEYTWATCHQRLSVMRLSSATQSWTANSSPLCRWGKTKQALRDNCLLLILSTWDSILLMSSSRSWRMATRCRCLPPLHQTTRRWQTRRQRTVTTARRMRTTRKLTSASKTSTRCCSCFYLLIVQVTICEINFFFLVEEWEYRTK